MPKPNISLLIADDHPMVRKGLRTMLSLNGLPFTFDIDEASDGEEAIAAALRKKYDVVITDYNLPKFTGDEVSRRILFYDPKARILVLSNYDERSFMRNAYEAGVRGYLTKDVDVDYLVQCVSGVMKGKRFFPPGFLDELQIEEEVPAAKGQWEKAELKKYNFSDRQIEVLQLIIAGCTSVEIGQKLDISRRTVDVHRRLLLEKTGTKNATGLLQFAAKHGLL